MDGWKKGGVRFRKLQHAGLDYWEITAIIWNQSSSKVLMNLIIYNISVIYMVATIIISHSLL